jgi:hypothetical protein
MPLISFTKEELLYLDDGLTLIIEVDPDEPQRHRIGRNLAPMAVSVATADLLLKLGSALVYLADEGGNDKEIELDEEELWCIREVSQSNAVYFEKQVGLNIKIKIYRALLQMYTEDVLADADIITGDVTEETSDTIRNRLDADRSLEDDQI